VDWLNDIFGRGGFLPHGYCFTWRPGLLWSMVGADGVIAAAYFSIPLALITFTRKRQDVRLQSIVWLFSAFIFACGVTHAMEIWTVWRPDYGWQAVAKMVTAIASLVTAVVLWRLIPGALRIPSVRQLQSVIDSLEAEVKKRRGAEEQLLDTQQSLAATLEGIGAGFIATDRDGCVVRMNRVAQTALGWAEADARGRSLWTVFVREDFDALATHSNPVQRMLAQGSGTETLADVCAISRDGRQLVTEIKMTLTYGDDEQVRGLAMVFRDMSRLVRAEAESMRLAAIVESSFDAIIGKALDGRITNWNRAAQAMFGYSAEEALGQNVQMLIPADRKSEEMLILAAVSRGAAVPAFDTLRLRKDGQALPVSVTISPIRDARGLIVGASKIARDISRQRMAEAALRESEARLRFTLESAEIGDWDLNLASGAIRRSPRHDRCFGYDELQSDWTFDVLVRHVHPDDRAELLASFDDAVASRRDWRAECRVTWPDGGVHWIALHGNVQLDGDRATHMLGIIADTTSQRLAEEARLRSQRLEDENRQIQEASRLKSQFLANMSHELRTPLNAIIGFADLLRSGAVNQDSLKHQLFLEHIGTSGRHLLQLINDVLDLSKVESGKFEFFPEPVELLAVVREVGDILHTAVQRKHLQVVTDIDPSLVGLHLDSARLKQVLYNYLSNAIKFTPEHGAIKVRAMPEGPAKFRIEVEDNGIGIAAVDIPRLFTEFQQLDSGYTKRHQGTGLGLALTRRLVQAQGGSVGVRSAVGRGSVFHLVLYRVHVADEPRATDEPDSTGRLAAHRILVIDDDGRAQSRMVHDLSRAGFIVDAVSTGEQALHQANNFAYDAITLDLMMPDQGGLAVLAKIRQEGPSHKSPVVGVSMPAQDGATAAFFVADVMAKPIRTQEVSAAMTGLLRDRTTRPRVLVIDDDVLALDLMQATLSAIGMDAICLLDGRQALNELATHRPDAIVLDLMMPDFDGFEVLDALQRMPQWRDTPVFIWTSMVLDDADVVRLANSAQAILTKGGGALHVTLEALSRWRPSGSASRRGQTV